jgi:copper(I)-binding protein
MKHLTLLICTLLLSVNSFAKEIDIDNPYARATPPHTVNSATFFNIVNNTDKNVELVAAKSDVAERTELHNHVNEDGMMKMRQVEKVMINAHGQTTLQPGGYHVMLLGLKAPLIEGQTINLTLYFDNGDEVKLTVPVQKITMSQTMSDKKHH